MIEEFLGPFDILLHMHPSHMHILNFIVAVPYSERGMMTKAFYIVFNLFFYIVKKVIIKERIGLTGKLKILPNKYSFFVTEIIKFVAFVVSAAPNAYHIYI